MSALQNVLDTFRTAAKTPRELGTYFEELTVRYFKTEPAYRELYRAVLPYADWAKTQGLDGRDAGIDLVAETVSGEVHAIQCKLYAADYRLQKSDIDSFFTASGKKPFARRIIVSTTNQWSAHAEAALGGQQVPVSKIDLAALEDSVIDWSLYASQAPVVVKDKKALRPHQQAAHEKATAGLLEADRGRLIMACGTGKTFTSLKIAETLAGEGKHVLFLVPSLALLSQTLTEWTQESEVPLHNFAVCSDTDVGKKRDADSDAVETLIHELHYPATTDAARLAVEVKKRHDGKHMSVVYATYHSIAVLNEAQQKHGLPDFDLIVCDEAHRTTGAKFEGVDESHFTKVHDQNYIRGKKRIYMTATPKIFGQDAKDTAKESNIALSSMDDEALYGKLLYVLTFSAAVKRGLLVDYKVVVLSIEESHVSRRIQSLLKDENNELRVDDAAKIIGCWKALAKQGLAEQLAGDANPMKRAVAFCQVIEKSAKAKTHKVSSKNIASMFQAVVEAYQEGEPHDDDAATHLRCEAEHVDGGMNATLKKEKIDWLKAKTGDDTCRILSNVRCLSEGVDVPALDAVLFLTPRNSQIDVVQSVGRVMRKSPGKTRGYIVLPVVVPAGMKPHEALNDNQTYKVVWQVLQALRSHDDRFDAMVNKLDLTGRDTSKMEVIAITDKIAKPTGPKSKKARDKAAAMGGSSIGTAPRAAAPENLELEFEIGEIERAIYAKLVEKVGNRHHWEDWAKDIAKIAATHVDRITGILENKQNVRENEAFARFAHELKDDLNDSITDAEIVEMLAQHLVTKPVFDALFTDHSFATENPMSRAMQGVLDVLQEHRLDKEADTLKGFYDSVKLRAEGIDNAEGKQKIVVELYDKFFRNAFPKMAERLGIVYTPVEIVDFILKSVDHLLREEFGQNLGSKGVHILDPFTGTGTFITRLLQSGLIAKEDLAAKYAKEIHANEIVLLAYYIAAINIEAAYHGLVGGKYKPFEGICLTDTFQLYEKDDLVSRVLVDNSARRTRQKKLDIKVILGNPPYSVGQDSANDDNQNVGYPSLDARIRETYAAHSANTNMRGLYDSYIRAIRWASDRVGESGIVGFVTNANFVEASTADGLRKCLAEEYSSLYVFHLRGNARTSGERRRKEGGNAFGMGSRAPVAISLLVKNPRASECGRIFFRDIGDYLTQEEKLKTIADFGSVEGLRTASAWTEVVPNAHHDWVGQREQGFSVYAPISAKGGESGGIFATHSAGLKTNRDAWVYDWSKTALTDRLVQSIAFFNAEAARRSSPGFQLNTDPTRFKWCQATLRAMETGKTISFVPAAVRGTLFRPFTRTWVYMHRSLNWSAYQMPRIFPDAIAENRVIGASGLGSRTPFSCLMSIEVPNHDLMEKVQFYPLYLYDSDRSSSAADEAPAELFAAPKKTATGTGRRDGITDEGLAHFQAAYPGETITKEDVFYYVYGLLHSEDYRERYADNLGKELPRMPRMKTVEGFRAVSAAGRLLGDLHVGYEKVAEYPATIEVAAKAPAERFRVEKMKFGKGKDKSVVHYNGFVTVRGIPLEAYDYVVNGKPAIEWVMERQSVTTDKDSGIVKDANAWATETVGDPRYPLSLLLRVVTVSLETMKIVRALPALDIYEEPVGATILPFRRVTPKAEDRYRTCVPLVGLSAAAGAWSALQEALPELDDPSIEWVTWNDPPAIANGMFVAQVTGRSMEPRIPDGAYCLFRRVSQPTAVSSMVLVRHAGDADFETGGEFTVKLYREEGRGDDKRVVLEPINPAFKPLVVTAAEASTVRVIAEVVQVLRV